MATLSYVRGVLITIVVVLTLSLAIALASFGGRMLESPSMFAGATFVVAAGPVGGWIGAAKRGSIFDALWSLLPLTALTLGPLLLAIRATASRHIYFSVAAGAWLLAGFYYGIAIWV
jgi:hypothetical protein